MRSPSFLVNSRTPSAFGVGAIPKRFSPRPAGQTIDPTCANNTYHGVRFYDVNQNCLDVNQNISGQVYNQYGYPIDAYGNPQIGSPPASWALIGTQGQAWDQPNTGVLLDSNGNVIGAQQNTGVGTTVVTPVTTNATSAQNQALYNSIGPALNTTGAAITAAIQSNNQQQLAQMQLAAQTQIAQLQLQAQQATAAGNLSLAQQRLSQLGPLQQFQAQLNASTQQNTTLYILGAIVALGVIGAAVYFRPMQSGGGSSRRSTRRNPFVIRNPLDGHMKHMRHARRLA